MKCQQCGHENPESAIVCEQCNAELVKEEGVLTATEMEETPQEEANKEEVKTDPVKIPKPKITIKPETKEKFGNACKEAMHFIGQTILHPKQEMQKISWGAMGVVALCIAVVNILWLYILQRGLITALTIMTQFMPIHMPIKMSSLVTILGGMIMTVVIVILLAMLVMIGQASHKERVNVKLSVANAMDIYLVPTLLLLISTVVAAFWFNAGLVCFIVVFIALFMNVVFLFKESNSYLAYFVVTIAIVALLFVVIFVIQQCCVSWTINGANMETFFKNIFTYYFSM